MQSHNPQPIVDSNAEKGGSAAAVAPQADSHTGHTPLSYSNHTGRLLGLFAGIVAVGLVVAFILVQRSKAARIKSLDEQAATVTSAPILVDVVSVQKTPPTQTLTLPGESRAWYETTIYGRVSGYVADWRSDIGDHVKKGQVLATIDTPELDDQLIAAQAKLVASQADVTVTKANADFAKSTYDRWWDSPKGVVSEQEREEKKAAYDSSVAKLASANAQVNLDQADVDRLTALTKFKQVTAPFDGTITARRLDIGDLVTAGSTSSTTSLFSIDQSERIRVFVDVPQSAAMELKPGMSAQIIARELPGRTFEGKLARTSGAIDSSSRTMRVEVDIPNPDLALMPGMYVQTCFTFAQPELMQIPASALVFRTSGPQVAVVDASGKVSFRSVAISRDLGDVIEISSGLSSSERVALNISNQVGDGQQVSTVDAEKATAAAPAPTAPATPVLAASAARHG